MRIEKLEPPINFDGLSLEELDEYYYALKNSLIGHLGVRESTRKLLLYYVDAKRIAMQQRQEGYIASALKVERLCEAIYKQLPKRWKW